MDSMGTRMRSRKKGVFLTKGRCRAEECEGATVYGVAYYDGGERPVVSVSDVSPDRRGVKRLVDLCNRYGVDGDSLFYIVEDFLI